MRPKVGRAVLGSACFCLLLVAARCDAALLWYEHYSRGLEAEQRAAWAEALEEFGAAAKFVHLPQRRILTYGRNFIFDYDPHYHMALCLVALGRPKWAANQLKVAQQAGVTPPEKLRAVAQKIQEAMAERFGPTATPAPAAGELRVESDPPGAHVFVDGVEQGSTPLGPISVAPGEHAVRVEAFGFRPVSEQVTAREGTSQTLMVPLLANPNPAPRPTAIVFPPAGRTSPPVEARLGPAKTTARETIAAAAPTTAALDQAAAPPTAPPASPTHAPRPITIPDTRGARGLPYLLASLVLLALAGALWLRRPRKAESMTPTGPTLVYEQATTLPEAGARLGNYELQGVLGRGGMATTYRARRLSDGETVAVKVPHDGCLADDTFVARFLREGKLGEQLHHPRIVRIHAAGEEKGRPYLAMELIIGHTLKQELRECGPVPLRRALEVTRDIAEALDYAHAKGVVHRDLKPENVMVLPDGTLKVMDFGIARLSDQPALTTSNLFIGTPLYAAPEMVDPKRVDHRVDLYALGIILYEMLEGAVPFTADSPFRVLEMHMRQPLPAREQLPRPVPAPVWLVVLRLCEKDPAARYPSAERLLVELHRLLQHFPELEGA